MAGLACAILAVAVGVTGLLEAAGAVELPLALEPLARRLPTIFPVHMAAGAAALLLIVAALALRRRPALHRPVGRIALIAVLIGGAAALPSALSSSAGTVARAGFLVQGLVWLGCAALGYAAIRARRVALHRAAMLATAAVAFGAVVLRLMLAALDRAGLETFDWYGVVAWSAWLIPLGVALAVSAVGKRRPRTHKGPMTDSSAQPSR